MPPVSPLLEFLFLNFRFKAEEEGILIAEDSAAPRGPV